MSNRAFDRKIKVDTEKEGLMKKVMVLVMIHESDKKTN